MVHAKRIVKIGSNQQVRVEYDGSDNPIYIGYAARGLAAGTDGWLLQKLTWTSGNMTLLQVGYGNWTNRASESYA